MVECRADSATVTYLTRTQTRWNTEMVEHRHGRTQTWWKIERIPPQ